MGAEKWFLLLDPLYDILFVRYTRGYETRKRYRVTNEDDPRFFVGKFGENFKRSPDLEQRRVAIGQFCGRI